MAGGFYHLDHKEVIHVNVKKLDGNKQPEYKKFSIDPQITSFEMLQSILARAFEIKSAFTISYRTRDCQNHDAYLSMLSDWDMDAAFQCAAEPFLKLHVDVQHFEELEDWDVIVPGEIPAHGLLGLSDKTSILGSITGVMQRSMGPKHPENEVIKPVKVHMTKAEFSNYLDSAGVMIQPDEFRLSVFQGGIEPSLRQVGWRHLLNIYPANLTSQDRLKYLKQKEKEYNKLKSKWQGKFTSNTAEEEVKHVVCMVKRDVLRTDRSHDFYAGSDDNANTMSLFHILVTYALTHPSVSYCQGMSDLASPLLITQKSEGHAYICFCALMDRLRENFTSEGSAIMMKFRHLSELLCLYDPILYLHLQQNSAEDMFFCYRWFLLELKREFPLNDALCVLEAMWATLPHRPPDDELALVDPDYFNQHLSTSPCSPAMSFHNAVNARFLTLRRFGIHAKATKPIPSPVNRVSVNNNLSTEPSPNNSGSSTDPSISSLNTTPGGHEDRASNFPEVVDNSVSYLVKQPTDNIKELLWDNDIIDNRKDCPSDIVTDDRLWLSSSSYYSNDTIGHTLEAGNCNNCPNLMDLCHEIPSEQDNVLCTDFISDLDTGRQSWSLSSVASESSETDNHQFQFTLSLDSNTNHSTDISSAMPKISNCNSSVASSKIESKRSKKSLVKEKNNKRSVKDKSYKIPINKTGLMNRDFSTVEPNHSLFQSVKQLLTASWQHSANSRGQEANGLSQSTPRRPSSLSSKFLSLNKVCSAATQEIGLAKNMSDSHISDCQEATEDFGDSESIYSSFTNSAIKNSSRLPPPHELGAGNPFLMFLCLSLLIQHRGAILNQGMGYEEVAMHFDRLVRKHNAICTLHFARQMYTQYLKDQRTNAERLNGDSDEFSLSS